MKGFIKSTTALIFVLFSGLLFSQGAFAATVNGFNFKPGDILITKSTSSNGLTGHAGIVLPDGYDFVSIAGYGAKPEERSIDWWLNKQHYKTKVVRDNNSTEALKGAKWAMNNYVNGKYRYLSYGIAWDGVQGFHETYCSKIVWQSFYFGANKNYKVSTYPTAKNPYYVTPNQLIQPYDYINSYFEKYNGFKTVYSFGW